MFEPSKNKEKSKAKIAEEAKAGGGCRNAWHILETARSSMWLGPSFPGRGNEALK